MPKLPRISGRQAVRAFERVGWVHQRTASNHMMLVMPGMRTLVVPDYDDLPPFILRGLLRSAGMTVDEFLALL